MHFSIQQWIYSAISDLHSLIFPINLPIFEISTTALYNTINILNKYIYIYKLLKLNK